ncbi:MAG: C25 family cysteine peptidase, partial [Patescibacteria group bacterium]
MENQPQVEEVTKVKTNVLSSTKTAVATLLVLGLVSGVFAYGVVGQGGLFIKSKTQKTTMKTESVSFTVEVPQEGINKQEIGQDGVIYNRLSFVEEPSLYDDTTGTPELPYLTKLVVLPEGAENIKVNTKVKSALKTENIKIYPIPKQNPVKDEKGDTIGFEEEFYLDEIAYQKDNLLPVNLAQVEETGSVRSANLARLKIYPFQYNPSQDTFEQYQKVDVIVSYILPKETKLKKNKLGSLAKELKNWVENPEDLTKNTNTVQTLAEGGQVVYLDPVADPNIFNDPGVPIQYIIVVYDGFADSSTNPGPLNAFATYRATTDNINIAIAKTSDIYTEYPWGWGHSNNAASVKDFIRNAYENWPQATQPEYLLLLGDVGPDINEPWVPTKLQGEANNDDYFAYLEGEDEWQDMMVGRISIRSADDITNVLEKIQNYEQMQAGDFHERAVFAGHQSDPNQKVESWEDSLKGLGFDTSILDCVHTQEFMDELYGGFVFRRGHGNKNVWYGCLNVVDVILLDNSIDKNPIIMTNSCLTANVAWECDSPPYDLNGSCIGEILVNWPDKGAVAYYGATEIVFFDHTLPHDYLDEVFVNSNYTLGKALLNLELSGVFENESHILLGDPALHSFGYVRPVNEPDLT